MLRTELQQATKEREEVRRKYTLLASNTEKELSCIRESLEKISKNMKEAASKSSAYNNIVSLAAVFSIVTQRSSPRALRDDTKNGCEGDYRKVSLRN